MTHEHADRDRTEPPTVVGYIDADIGQGPPDGAPGRAPLHGVPPTRDADIPLPNDDEDPTPVPEPTGTDGNRRGPNGYRCCKHCREDTVHDVPTDGHGGPCQICDDPGAMLRERVANLERELADERAKVAEARRRLWTLGELIAEECAESDGEELCHEHDRTDSGGCALLTDLRAIYAELGGA